MQFNSNGFQQGVKSTLDSLKQLDEKLKMKGLGGKGLDSLQNGLKNVNSVGIHGLNSGVEAAASKFSALGVIGVTALANITNKAVNAGISIAKSLTIDPIKTGLSEYETKMNSMQTIYANTSHKGTTYDDIVKALDELNTYSDKTIYNFAQMTDNIGKFTSAGVDLDKSVSSIKGLANVAAMSGVDNARAAGVMYQASQAMSKGYFQLMDWRSFSNNGMGNERFRNALIDMSEVMGTGAKAAIEAAGSFDESLSKSKWLTADVMAETLAVLAGTYDKAALLSKGFSEEQAKAMLALAKDAENAATEIRTVSQLFDTMKENVQSGWAKSWEWIIGDKEQATKLLTGVSKAFENVITPIADARNAMLQFWNENGGRDAVISGLGNVFTSLGKILGSVGSAFREIFPAMTGEKLVDISKKFEKFTEKLKVSDDTLAKIKNMFKGLFSIFDVGKSAVSAIVKSFSPIGGIFKDLAGVFLTVGSSIGTFFANIADNINSGQIFEKVANGIQKGITGIYNICKSATSVVGNIFNGLSNANFQPFVDSIGKIGGAFGEGAIRIFTGLGEAVSKINFNSILGAITAIGGYKAFDSITSLFGGLKEGISSFGDIASTISDTLSGVKDALQSWQNDLKASTLIKIATAIGILAASLTVLSTINQKDLGNALGSITAMFIELMAAMSVLNSMDMMNKKKSLFNGMYVGMISLAASILLLATALRIISGINPKQVATGLVGLAGSMLILVAAVKLIDKGSKGLKKSATGMIALGLALNIMALAVKQFASIKPDAMIQGLVGVGVAMLEIAAFMALMGKNKMKVSNATGILILAAALLVLQKAVSAFGSMKVDGLTRGMAAMASIMAMIAVFNKVKGSALGLLTSASAMVVMGAAMNIFAGALRSMATMKWDDIARSLTAFAGGLTIVAIAVRLISGLDLATTGLGLMIMSTALLIFSSALNSLGSMSWSELGIGLTALAGGLLILGIAMAAMTSGIAGAAAMLIMSAALAIFIPQLILLSNLSWEQVAIGLVALAGAFTVLGIAGLVLTPILPSLALLAGVVALLGVACLAAGAGISLFAAGIGVLAGVGSVGINLLVDALRGLLQLLPELGKNIGLMIVEFAKVMGESIPALAQGIGGLFTGVLTAIRDNVPLIITVFSELIVALCDALAEGVPQMVDAGIKLITGLLEGLSKNMIDLVSAGAELVINFLDGISQNIAPVIEAGINLTISFIEGLATGIEENSDRFASAVEHLITAVCNSAASLGTALFTGVGNSSIGGLIAGFASKVGSFLSTVGQCISNAYNTARSKISAFLSTGREYITNLITGIKNKASAAVQAVRSICEQVVSAAKAKASALVSAGRSMIEGFVSGIKEKAASVAEAARSVVEKAVSAAKSALQINSPSKVFIKIGKGVDEGLALGIERNTNMVSNASEVMATSAIANAKSVLSKIGNAINGDIDSNPTITPVMDLSNVQAGSRLINGMLGNAGNIGLNTNVAGRMVGGIGTIQNGSNNTDIVNALKDLQKTITNKTGDTYNVNGITYDDGSNIVNAVQTLVRATKIERRM